MDNEWNKTFEKLVDVNIPIIYVYDFDFARVDYRILNVIGDKDIVEWNPAVGTTDFRTKCSYGNGKVQTLESFLDEKYDHNRSVGSVLSKERYIVLREIQDYIDKPEIKTYLQLIAQRKLYDRNYNLTIIISSSILKIPEELKKYVSIIEASFPTEPEIKDLIDEHIDENKYDRNKFNDKARKSIMNTLKGLYPFEIDRMLDIAMSKNGDLSENDNPLIIQQKKSMVKSSGILELIDSPTKTVIDDIGGYNKLKNYLQNKAEIYNNYAEAMNFGVANPKGIFLVGMPGCGKSLAAKAAATLFNVPLLKMDMGSMMGKYVGESEERLRKAIMVAEAAAPCVLWIDEIEKAFSGVNGNNDIITRMFGYFLSWMQDKQSSVYVVATANNANSLPPELKRKGRFDEIFCMKLPNKIECENIFKIHMDKKKHIKWEMNEKLVDKAVEKGCNGADIESVVNSAVEICFLKEKEKGKEKEKETVTVTKKILLEILENTKSISETCSEDIKKMEEVFKKSNFISASDDEPTKK